MFAGCDASILVESIMRCSRYSSYEVPYNDLYKKSMEKLDGRRRVVVITGASAGFGRCDGRAFAQKGANIALLAQGIEGLKASKTYKEFL